jgi:hypothetical protein
MTSAIVLTRPISAGTGGSTLPGLTTTTINGQPMLTLEDTTRSNKVLSVSEQVLVFAENRIAHLDWIRIATTADAESGYIADFDGTVMSITAHCENSGTNSKDLHLIIDNTDVGTIASLTGGANSIAVDSTLNIDFVQGQRLRLQAFGNTTGPIEDTVIKLTVKWRLV